MTVGSGGCSIISQTPPLTLFEDTTIRRITLPVKDSSAGSSQTSYEISVNGYVTKDDSNNIVSFAQSVTYSTTGASHVALISTLDVGNTTTIDTIVGKKVGDKFISEVAPRFLTLSEQTLIKIKTITMEITAISGDITTVRIISATNTSLRYYSTDPEFVIVTLIPAS